MAKQNLEVVAIDPEEAIERWSNIVDALATCGIPPDLLTLAALHVGVVHVSGVLGVVNIKETTMPRKASIGFAGPVKES